MPYDTVLELNDLENNTGVITRGKGRTDADHSLGGGVFVQGVFVMNGGRIMGNSATTGGGIYVDAEGTFRMRGGKVTGNTVTGYGGGVFVRGSVEAAGTVSITDNSNINGGADNLRLAANVDLVVTGALNGSIGINKASVPVSGSPVTLTTGLGGNGMPAIFTSDNTSYNLIQNEQGDVLLAVYCLKDKTCPISKYTDTKVDGWYHDGIHFVLDSGMMSGYGEGLFGPNDSTTRAMTATILWNMAGKPKSEARISFIDVPQGKWYTEAVRWAAEVGIIVGNTDGISGELIFRPDDFVTREQLATMIYRYAKAHQVDVSIGETTSILKYDDAFSVGSWAVTAMQWTTGSGLMAGRTSTTLDPRATATRAEVATVIMRYCTKVAK